MQGLPQRLAFARQRNTVHFPRRLCTNDLGVSGRRFDKYDSSTQSLTGARRRLERLETRQRSYQFSSRRVPRLHSANGLTVETVGLGPRRHRWVAARRALSSRCLVAAAVAKGCREEFSWEPVDPLLKAIVESEVEDLCDERQSCRSQSILLILHWHRRRLDWSWHQLRSRSCCGWPFCL